MFLYEIFGCITVSLLKLCRLYAGKVGASCVVYKIGECMQELIKLWKEYESLQADKSRDGAQNGPTLEICIPAEHVTATNRQVRYYLCFPVNWDHFFVRALYFGLLFLSLLLIGSSYSCILIPEIYMPLSVSIIKTLLCDFRCQSVVHLYDV